MGRKALLYCCYITMASLVFGGCGQKRNHESKSKPPEPKWYSNMIIYNLDVDVFKDSDGDGIGDFKGLAAKLGYLDSLGADAIWLAPFQPTPDQDDGYDITDFYGIDKRLGTKADFDAFISAAKKKGIKVMMDIVVNHTSIEHPWFSAARADTNSKYNKWYVWSAEKPKDWDKGMVFPGVQNETWTYDEVTKKYYFHRFYDFQPDLNFERKDVQKMAIDVLTYWLKQGIDGFRLDAVPFIIDKPETGTEDPKHMFAILDSISAAIKRVNPDVALLGEANVTAEENADYFGAKGERLQMMFNFFADQYLFYSLAKNNPSAFAKALEDFREKPASCQWVFFLRNHDEADLARLKSVQRQAVYDKFGPETSMQLYDRGIRRRLAPMLGDPAMIRMSYSLLFSLPGAQMIRYGEEIGMGDDLTLRERLSVRTPMQWDSTVNSGFSSASKTFRPVIAYGDYTYRKVNVENELADGGSLLNLIRKLIVLRKAHPEIGLGNWEILDGGNSDILVMRYTYQHKTLITAHNFSGKAGEFSIPEKQKESQQLISSFSSGGQQSGFSTQKKIRLPAYGFVWLTLSGPGQKQ